MRTALLLLLTASVGWSAQRPDVLMIAVDDLRPMLGCYGDTKIKTPNIDRLAARGVVFERAYCNYAKCGTSRLSLMSGLRPDAIGVFSNNDRDVKKFRQRRPDAISLARHLKNSGYYARGLGKIYHDGWDVASEWSEPPSPGRDREMWEVLDEKNPTGPTIIAERWECPVMQAPDVGDDHLFAGRMTEQALAVLRDRPGKQPLFLAVGYRRPHLPFVAPKRYWDLYQPDESWLAKNPLPAQGSPVMAWFNSDGYVGGAKRAGLTMPNPPNRRQGVEWNGYEMRSYQGVPKHGPIKKELQLELLHAYAACVSYVDTQIGRLLKALENSGRLHQTVIVLWSDHGWHLGEQSAWGKMTNFEIATRVPLIIAAPGIKPARTKSLAELVDLYPTLCELTGAPAPPHLEGESLVPALREPASQHAPHALSQYARYREKYMGRAIRTAQYRYVAWYEKKSGKVVERELYDLTKDPHETRNLAHERPGYDVVSRMHARLTKVFAR